MSKNSQDGPDEYEIIFDGAKSDSSSHAKIEVSDAEPEADSDSPSEYIDAEVDPIDPFMKRPQNDGEDEDIEDGIFAPTRQQKGTGKKTTSLMWAVSLLAFVGVGSFVYVSNPDILSKVTHNFGSTEDVTLPNDATTADGAYTTAETIAQPDPTLHTPENTEEIKPDAIDGSTDLSQSTATADPANINVTANDVPVVNPTNSTESAPVEAIAPTADLTATLDQTSVQPAISTPIVPTPVNPDSTPSVADAIVPTSAPAIETPKAVSTSNSSEVMTPINDKEVPATEVALTAQTTQPVATAPSTGGTSTSNISAQAVKSADTKADSLNAPTNNAPVIVSSKEEKKALDDANLDKYFDSPDGKMLKDIPAPSMNPNKGGNESIIVVNKKGKKTNTDYSQSMGKVSIETTSLNAQMVSANRALKLGRYDAAKEMYDDLYRLNPRDAQILSGRAILLQKMGYNDQAISAYEELLSLYPDNTDAIVNLSGLIRKQYPAVALSKLLDLHMAHPNNVAVTAQLGVAYADSGNYPDAMRYLGDAATMDPKNALHFYNMAVISEKAKKPDQAVTYYEKALEVDAIYGDGHKTISKEKIYDRLAQIRGN